MKQQTSITSASSST